MQRQKRKGNLHHTFYTKPDVKGIRKAVRQTMRNNKTTTSSDSNTHQKCCKCYPYFCNVLGHGTTILSACRMYEKTKYEMLEAATKIEEILVRELLQKQGEGK